MNMQKALFWLRVALAVNFIWFGMLKFFPQMSPAEELALKTIDILTLALIPQVVSIKLLALWEVFIGIGFLLGKKIEWVVSLFLLHMVLTFSPLFLFPELCFIQAPHVLTLVGQYIIKNSVLIMGGIILYIGSKEMKYKARN